MKKNRIEEVIYKQIIPPGYKEILKRQDMSIDMGLGIRIDKRWFSYYSKCGHLVTAWSLAGAKLFRFTDLDRVIQICESERKKKKETYAVIVGVLNNEEYEL